MCGIAGSVNFCLPDETVQMIRHRGPDEFGAYETIINRYIIRLFHHRLSILDLSANGSQPMLSADGRGLIIFNGEIYNHNDLRKNMHHTQFRGHSDTETLVNLCRSGVSPDTMSQLNGIFAFAYLDLQKGILYLVRDRFGVKPLYYYFKDGAVIFSSELRPILDRVTPGFSIGAVTATLELRHVPAPATLFKNIYKVEPGQYVEIKLENDLAINRYYFADIPRLTRNRNTTRRALVADYGSLLEKAVERQLQSDVEVGVLLSGGVDSSLITAIAKSKMKNIKAFTVGFNDKELDETENARITARHLNVEHYCAEVKFDNFLKEFENIVDIVEEPVDTGSIFSMYTLSELASSKVKVVLSGQGADEPLGGYTKYKALPAIDILSQARLLHGSFQFLSRNTTRSSIRRVLSATGTPNDLQAYFEFNSLFGNHALRNLLNAVEGDWLYAKYQSCLQSFQKVLQSWKNLPTRRSELYPYLDTRTKLPETLLKYTDKITMHFSLECRVPMLDNDLVAFVESLPRKYRFSFGNRKIIHKLFAKEYLPEEIVHRKKLAFHAPSGAYLKNHADQVRQWMRSNDNWLFWRIFNKNRILQLFDEHERYGNREKELILIMSTLFLTIKKKVPVLV